MRQSKSCKHLFAGAAIALVGWLVPSESLFGEQVIFTIDPGLSSQTWFGNSNSRGPFVAQSSGSLTAGVRGHFMVDFDPLTHTPTTLQFVGGHGYMKLDSAHNGAPTVVGTTYTTTLSPANVAGRIGAGGPYFAVRDFLWDFASAPIAGTGGVFPANQTNIAYDAGSHLDVLTVPSPGHPGTFGISLNIQTVPLSGGTWTLSESAPGTGDWTLSLSGDYYHESYSDGNGPIGSGTLGFGGQIVSSAHFGAQNVTALAPAATQADVLGGAAQVGGVSAQFSQPTGGGSLSVQQVPNQDALSFVAAAAAEENDLYQLSTGALAGNPQIWNVDFSGSLNGGNVALKFNYDPALLPNGIDPMTLKIWHYNSAIGQWESGGTVDPLTHTITYVTDSFSPFQLGISVPEPSTLTLAAVGCVAIVGMTARRRRTLAGR